MAESPYLFEITSENYKQVVLRGSYEVPVLVDFWASWCQPCQVLMPVLAGLADEYQGRFVLAKLNTEEQQAIAMQFGIRSIPTVMLFRDGSPVDEFMGALPESQIRAFLDRHLPRDSDNAVAEARQHLLQGDAATALKLLRDARASDPANPRVAVALAQAQAASGDIDGAEQSLEALPDEERERAEIRHLHGQLFFDRIALEAGERAALAKRVAGSPDDSEARYRLAAHQVVDGDVEGALENLMTLMQRDRGYGDDAARAALLRLFDMLGDDPLATRYRARMFNLLH